MSELKVIHYMSGDSAVEDSKNTVVFRGEDAKIRAEQYAQFMRNPCLRKLKIGEPFFVLRGQDPTGAGHVRDWAARARLLGTPEAKLAGAYVVANNMEEWYRLMLVKKAFPD